MGVISLCESSLSKSADRTSVRKGHVVTHKKDIIPSISQLVRVGIICSFCIIACFCVRNWFVVVFCAITVCGAPDMEVWIGCLIGSGLLLAFAVWLWGAIFELNGAMRVVPYDTPPSQRVVSIPTHGARYALTYAGCQDTTPPKLRGCQIDAHSNAFLERWDYRIFSMLEMHDSLYCSLEQRETCKHQIFC